MYIPKSNTEISIENKFISLRHVKEALNTAFNVQVEEETASSLRGKIVRFARLYGGPIIWPSATIEIQIDNENNKLFCTYSWPDYYMLFFSIVLVFMFATRSHSNSFPLVLCIIAPLLQLFMIYLDTLYVQSRIKRFMKKMQVS